MNILQTVTPNGQLSSGTVLFSKCSEPKRERVKPFWCVCIQQECVLWGGNIRGALDKGEKDYNFPPMLRWQSCQREAEESSECNGCITALGDALLMQT